MDRRPECAPHMIRARRRQLPVRREHRLGRGDAEGAHELVVEVALADEEPHRLKARAAVSRHYAGPRNRLRRSISLLQTDLQTNVAIQCRTGRCWTAARTPRSGSTEPLGGTT